MHPNAATHGSLWILPLYYCYEDRKHCRREVPTTEPASDLAPLAAMATNDGNPMLLVVWIITGVLRPSNRNIGEIVWSSDIPLHLDLGPHMGSWARPMIGLCGAAGRGPSTARVARERCFRGSGMNAGQEDKTGKHRKATAGMGIDAVYLAVSVSVYVRGARRVSLSGIWGNLSVYHWFTD